MSALATSSSLDGCFAADHGFLDMMLEWVIDAIERPMSRRDVARLFTAYERYVSDHLEIEERNLLSELARVREASANVLLGDHRELRDRMTELRTKAEGGLLSVADLRRLSEELDAHAAREEQSLRSWSAAGLSLSQLTKILRYMSDVATQRSRHELFARFSRF